jgi:hypothetical protein
MKRVSCLIATVTVTLATQAMPARAQFNVIFPGSTVQGDILRGDGESAYGWGLYNHHSALGRAIDADTLWRSNQYLYLSQQEANRIYRERYRTRRDQIVGAREKTDRRLRDAPTPRDIASGDALNVALDELRDPRVSLHVLKGVRARLRGPLVRDIPLRYAPEAITISVNQLLQDGPPPVLRSGAFAAERTALEQFTAEVRKGLGGRNELRPETIDRGLDLIRAMWVKVEAALPGGTAARREAEAYLKGWSVLCRLLGTSAAAVLLAGADGCPETRLGELLNVLSLHDLRFGVARTPRQRAVYDELYPLLASLRDEARPAVAVATTPAGRVRP